MTTPETRTRGTCRVCRQSVRLDTAGRITSHPTTLPADLLDVAIPPNCGGVGYLPAGAR